MKSLDGRKTLCEVISITKESSILATENQLVGDFDCSAGALSIEKEKRRKLEKKAKKQRNIRDNS